MNFKRYHVSKNLFDKNNADIYPSTNISTGISRWAAYEGIARTVRIPCSANTTYAISIDSAIEQTIFRGLLINTDNVPVIENPVLGTVAISSSDDNTAVFTTLADTKYIVLQFSATIFDDAIDSLMLVAGSQPLPYEPYSSEVWHDIPHYIHNTSTDTITTLPAVLYPNAVTATVGLKGDMEQTGTPSPQTPIQPSECGERTENLFDVNASISGAIKGSPYTAQDYGTLISSQYTKTSDYIPITPNTQYTFRCNNQNPLATASRGYAFYDDNKQVINIGNNTVYDILDISTLTVTTPNTAAYMRISWDINATNIMLNLGSTSLPYEPYGQYKIPILSGGTTTPVYLGEVESTRRIYRYAFTGQESDLKIQASITATNAIQLPTTLSDYKRESFVCSHMPIINSSTDPNTHGFAGQFLTLCFDLSMGLDTLEKVRTYLQQQYAAGTPVTVWYVLATPTTGIVNEPIRKIGDYADEVSGITIPVTAGANTLLVGTTLQPSEVTVNYKGWHPVQSVHEMHTHLDASLFELGTITGYGQKDELTTRIRTKTFIDLSNTKSINTLSSAKVFLIAWTEEATTIGYYYCVGGWNGSSFGNQTGLWLSEIDVESIVETYPTYKFAVILRYDDNREVTDFDDLLSLVDFYPRTW